MGDDRAVGVGVVQFLWRVGLMWMSLLGLCRFGSVEDVVVVDFVVVAYRFGGGGSGCGCFCRGVRVR